MLKRFFYVLLLVGSSHAVLAQKTVPISDSTAYYDDLFSELDSFLDSILAPRTMFLVNAGASNTFLNYTGKNGGIETKRALSISPSVGYYHKAGLGINLTGMFVYRGKKLNPYQLQATGSYDYLKANNFITGISFTRFFTKKDLVFYTSPLQNEVGGYFTYRKWWIKPSLSARYGWGSRSAVADRAEYITSLRLRPYGFTRVSSTESISDFSIAASVRHDFYKLDIFGKRTVLRVTPQLSLTAGTQNFGLNQSSNTYGTIRNSNNPVLFNSQESYLDNKLYFQPLAAAAFLKTELTLGKAFIQPQVAFNYYFPATDKHFTTILTVNAGFIF